MNVTSGVNAKLGGKPRPGKTLLPGGDGVDFNRCNLAEIYDYIKNCKAPSRKEKQLAIISSHENPVEKGQTDTKISSRKRYAYLYHELNDFFPFNNIWLFF